MANTVIRTLSAPRPIPHHPACGSVRAVQTFRSECLPDCQQQPSFTPRLSCVGDASTNAPNQSIPTDQGHAAHELDGLELHGDLKVIMLAVSSQLVCDQIEGADEEQSESSKNHDSGTFAEWRCTELLSMTYNHCVFLDWHDHTGEAQGDKLLVRR